MGEQTGCAGRDRFDPMTNSCTTKRANSTDKPPWLKVRAPGGETYHRLRRMLGELQLATVCQEALCPNIEECWNSGTATFMLMGDTCTRACRFCAVKTGNPRGALDQGEPEKVGWAIAQMQLDYVVLTSVDRDDLSDLGAGHFARTVQVIKTARPQMVVEALTPDFNGREELIGQVARAGVDVLAHNIETVEGLTSRVRDRRSGYRQSLRTLEIAKNCLGPGHYTKSSLMLGLGESEAEVVRSLQDLRDVGCDVVTLGQYLAPTGHHKKYLPVIEYVTPEHFQHLRQRALGMGFLYVAAGPLVRSSYRAAELFLKGRINRGS